MTDAPPAQPPTSDPQRADEGPLDSTTRARRSHQKLTRLVHFLGRLEARYYAAAVRGDAVPPDNIILIILSALAAMALLM